MGQTGFFAGTAVGRPQSRPLVSVIRYICPLAPETAYSTHEVKERNNIIVIIIAPNFSIIILIIFTLLGQGAAFIESVLRHRGRVSPTEERYPHGGSRAQGP